MATGLDVAAGFAGLISLSITAFRGCVKGFQLVSTAQHIGNDADRIRSMLEWEQYRLVQWADRIGLDAEGKTMNPTLNWTLIADFLKQLELLLTDIDTLKIRYNLEIDDDAVARVQMPKAVDRKGIGKLWQYTKPEIRTARARIIQENAGPVKRLRWATMDQDKVKAFLGQVAYFNNCLHELLQSVEQESVTLALATLLRDLVSRTTASTDLDIIKALLDDDHVSEASSIDAAANLKQIRLLLKIDQRSDEKITTNKPKALGANTNSNSPKQKLLKLNYQALSLIAGEKPAGNRHQVGVYRSSRKGINSQVLVEWKSVDKTVEKQLTFRIQSLAFMMANLSDPSFHSLPCLGFLSHEQEDSSSNLYAYVYQIADLSSPVADPHLVPTLRPLSTLFTVNPLPSLSFRISLSLSMAQTISQLHTSGWLHKSIHPANILFIDLGDRTWDSKTSLGPYVAGYEYARADNPLEVTEETPTSPEHNLYRHPSCQGVVRESFQKAFDLYSLGCVLLEIALWTPLSEVLFHIGTEGLEDSVRRLNLTDNAGKRNHMKWNTILEAKEHLLNKEGIKAILNQVAFHAGDEFAEIIRLCFFPMNENPFEDEDLDASIATQQEIVSKLKRLRC